MRLKQLLCPLSMGLLSLGSVNAYSQSTFIPKIIPPSPNAASIAKFGDMPVSTYSGTTDISVPFYAIKTKSISIPVSIDYHTGGIRLSEESGLVGLGWALNAGGMISRTVNDKDDFLGIYFNSQVGGLPVVPESKGKLLNHNFLGETSSTGLYPFKCNYQVYSEQGNVNYFSNIPYLNNYDWEPDMYNFNFPGGGGKFMIARDGKVILQKQDNLRVEYASDGSWFIITDEHGNKFYFLDVEYSQPATGGNYTKSSWLLSKIVTQQKDSVMFNYTTDNTWTTVVGISHENLGKGVPNHEQPIYSNDPGMSYLNKTLQSIDWANGELQFGYDASRLDLQSGKKLDTVRIYIKDQSGLHYLKENRMYYSYFNDAASDAYEFKRLRLDSVKEISGNTALPAHIFSYYMPSYNTNLMGKHYSSVDHWGYFNGKSNAVGGNYKEGFTPDFVGLAYTNPGTLTGLDSYMDLPGANREPDFTYMQAFALTNITYPTGGSTSLVYEPNYYDYNNSKGIADQTDFEYAHVHSKTIQIQVNSNGTTPGSIDLSDIYMTSNGLDSIGNITVAFIAMNKDSLNYYHNTLGYGKINFTFLNNTTDISNSGLQCSGIVTGGNCSGTSYSLAMPLKITTRGSYNWSAYIDPRISTSAGFSLIQVTITYKVPDYVTNTMMMAGGLRIKTITDYSAVGTVAKQRTYNYGYQQDKNGDGTMENYSYGRLLGHITYARQESISTSSQGAVGISLTRYGSSTSSLTSASSGNIVGYDTVTEYTIDPSNGNDNGKIVYAYYNSVDTSITYDGFRFPGVNNLPNNLNGLLRSQTIYKDIGKVYTKVSEKNSYYHAANRIIYNCMKYWKITYDALTDEVVVCYKDANGNDIPALDACSCPNKLDSAANGIYADFYPAISSEKVLLDSTVEKLYDQTNTTKVITTKSYNYYDNTKHYQLTRSKTWDSKANTHVTFIKYPQDYITSGNYTSNTILDSLIGRNMVAEAIEKRDSLYLSGSSTGYIAGAQLSKYRFLNANVLGLDKQYQLSIASPITNFQPFAISGNTTSQDSRYRQMISFDTYDNNYNILQFTIPSQSSSSFIWDYNNQYPVAQIVKATSDQVAYTSFESDGKGNWNTYTGTITTVTATTPPPTGNKYYNLIPSATLSKGVTSGKTYIISYWSKNGLYTITGGGTPTNTTGKTINSWTYYEQKVTASSSTLTITGTGAIDEVRLYPYDAQMTTYTYDAFGDMLSACDMNNRITYYEYDELQRLHVVRDQDRNVIKKICYNYSGQPSACDGKSWVNVVKSQSFQKNSCSPSYYIGSTVTYTVPASTYYSEISQADADQKALDDIAANGQNYANANGTCSAPPMINVTYTNPGTTSMTIVFKHKPSNTTYTFTLSSGKTTSTTAGQIMQGGPYDVTITPTSGSYLYNFQVYSYMQMNASSFSYTDMPSICSTCATISVTNQH